MIMFCWAVYFCSILRLYFSNREFFDFLAFLFSVLLNTLLLSKVLDWRKLSSDDRPKFTFCQFIKLYNVAPEKFILKEKNPHYRSDKLYNMVIDFKTFLDHCLYVCFAEQKKKRNKSSKHEKIEKELTDDFNDYIKRKQEKKNEETC